MFPPSCGGFAQRSNAPRSNSLKHAHRLMRLFLPSGSLIFWWFRLHVQNIRQLYAIRFLKFLFQKNIFRFSGMKSSKILFWNRSNSIRLVRFSLFECFVPSLAYAKPDAYIRISSDYWREVSGIRLTDRWVYVNLDKVLFASFRHTLQQGVEHKRKLSQIFKPIG